MKKLLLLITIIMFFSCYTDKPNRPCENISENVLFQFYNFDNSELDTIIIKKYKKDLSLEEEQIFYNKLKDFKNKDFFYTINTTYNYKIVIGNYYFDIYDIETEWREQCTMYSSRYECIIKSYIINDYLKDGGNFKLKKDKAKKYCPR